MRIIWPNLHNGTIKITLKWKHKTFEPQTHTIWLGCVQNFDEAACVCFHFDPKGGLEPDSSVKATHQPLWHRYRRHALIISHSSLQLNASPTISHHPVRCSSSALYSVHFAGREASWSGSLSGSFKLLSSWNHDVHFSLTKHGSSNTSTQHHTHSLSHAHHSSL